MSSEEKKDLPGDHIDESELYVTSRADILKKVERHVAAVDEKSINHYLQNRMCGVKPNLPCVPRYFLPEVERYKK